MVSRSNTSRNTQYGSHHINSLLLLSSSAAIHNHHQPNTRQSTRIVGHSFRKTLDKDKAIHLERMSEVRPEMINMMQTNLRRDMTCKQILEVSAFQHLYSVIDNISKRSVASTHLRFLISSSSDSRIRPVSESYLSRMSIESSSYHPRISTVSYTFGLRINLVIVIVFLT